MWTNVSSGLSSARDVRALAVIPSTEGIGDLNLFAGGDGVYLSTDGARWDSMSVPFSDVRAFTVVGTNLFAGTLSGVYLSTNRGTSWIDFSSGLQYDSTTQHYCAVGSLHLHGTDLFAGTDCGVWRRQLPEWITFERSPENGMPVAFRLHQNYPNPFNPSTIIKYELHKSSMVTLSVYDMLGREVSVPVNERRDAGVHEVTFDGSGLASGVYFYRLQAGGFVQSKRLVLLK